MIEGDICYDTLEEWICDGHPLDKILRALCLQSLCSGGLNAAYDQLKAELGADTVLNIGRAIIGVVWGLGFAGARAATTR